MFFIFAASKYSEMKTLVMNMYWWRNLQPKKS